MCMACIRVRRIIQQISECTDVAFIASHVYDLDYLWLSQEPSCSPCLAYTLCAQGNPNEEKYYQYISEYSPYDNVATQNYPAILITGGLYDPRVAYWEPTKWAAKLRHLKTDNNLLCLKIDNSGHFSASDRYKHLKEKAFDFAFILDQLHSTSLMFK